MSIITRVWAEQPGKFFCISTKDQDGKWHDEFFARKQFGLVQGYIDEVKKTCNVYWCCHGFSMKRRLRRYAEMPKLMWADLDETDPRGLDPSLKPTIAIESSPGRFAGWWMLDQVLDDDATNQKLTYFLKADKGGWDLTQVLRVPGTNNFKYKNAPRVRLLWADGPVHQLDRIKSKLPKAKDRPSTGAPDANKIFKKYREHLSPWARRELLKGKARVGNRSEVFWKLTNEILEAGASEAEAFEILWASPWNKFKERRDGMKQLQREIDKVYGNKMDSINPQQDYEDEAELPDEELSDEDELQKKILGSIVGVAENEIADWVLYPYLARGHITSIEGDPEIGKSWLSLAMASAISEGKIKFPSDGWDELNKRGSVFYFDAENDTGHIAQRIADSNMFTKVTNPHDSGPFFHINDMRVDFREEEAIDDVIDRINDTLKFYKNNKGYETAPALILFDTFINFAGDTDTNKQSDVMIALGNMKTLAKEMNCAVAIIRHFGKTMHSNAMHRGTGSVQFSATCRAMLGVYRHPDDPDTRVIMPSKSSLAVKTNLRALTYHLQPMFPGTTDVARRDRTKMVWGEWTDLEYYDLIETEKDQANKMKEQKEHKRKAKEVLDTILGGQEEIDDAILRQHLERNAIPLKDLNKLMNSVGFFARAASKTRPARWLKKQDA